MKKYQKAQMIAKNLPTGSYAAGCPAHTPAPWCGKGYTHDPATGTTYPCSHCEIAG